MAYFNWMASCWDLTALFFYVIILSVDVHAIQWWKQNQNAKKSMKQMYLAQL